MMAAGPAGTLILSVFVVLGISPAAARGGEAAHPFDGKSQAEIRKLIEEALERRKRAKEFFDRYRLFHAKEEKKLKRQGAKLAAQARTAGEYLQAEYFFRFGEHKLSLEILAKNATRVLKEDKAARARKAFGILNKPDWRLSFLYQLMAANHAYLRNMAEAQKKLQESRNKIGSDANFNNVQMKINELSNQLVRLDWYVGRRDRDPTGGTKEGENQWVLCQFLRRGLFLPVEEHIELLWMLMNFASHPNVKNGDAEWALIVCSEKLADYRAVLDLLADFEKKHGGHANVTNGEAEWLRAKALFGLGDFKGSGRAGDLIQEKFTALSRSKANELRLLLDVCRLNPDFAEQFSYGNWLNHWWSY